jgi:acyl carrier protein
VLDDEQFVLSASTDHSVDGWDSVAHIQLMIAIEEEFGVQLTAAEMAAMTSVPAILKVLEGRGAAR